MTPDQSLEQTKLIVIVGPTAVGKTEIAIQLAELFDAEIVSADSRLFYRGMDIGTAKPTLEDRKRVRHHLIDVAAPNEIWSLAVFQQNARAAVADIQERGKIPFLVGGTGQYIRSVAEGWDIPKVEPDPALRLVLERWGTEIGPGALHARLATIDPLAAAKIYPPNLRRTVRALEVIFTTGQLFSTQRLLGPSPYRLLVLGLNRPRDELYARIDARVDAMFAMGFVDEVRSLLADGYSPDLANMSAIGYREVVAYLQQEIDLDTAMAQIKSRTRLFVRRQANWFKPDDPSIKWFLMTPSVIDELHSEIVRFLH